MFIPEVEHAAKLGFIPNGNWSKADEEFCHEKLLSELEFSRILEQRQRAKTLGDAINW